MGIYELVMQQDMFFRKRIIYWAIASFSKLARDLYTDPKICVSYDLPFNHTSLSSFFLHPFTLPFPAHLAFLFPAS